MGFLVTWIWSKLKLFNLELQHILKMIKIKTVISSIQSVWVTRPTRSHLKATGARLGPIGGAWRKFCGFEATMRQCGFELTCFRTTFCFINISAPWYRTEMVLYSKFAYGSQFSEEKKQFKNPIVGYRDIKQKPSLIFFGTPCRETKHAIQGF